MVIATFWARFAVLDLAAGAVRSFVGAGSWERIMPPGSNER